MTAISCPGHASEGPECSKSDPVRPLELSDTAMEGMNSASSSSASMDKGPLSDRGASGSAGSSEGDAVVLPASIAMGPIEDLTQLKSEAPEGSRSGLHTGYALEEPSGALMSTDRLENPDSAGNSAHPLATGLVQSPRYGAQSSSKSQGPSAHDTVAAVKELIAQPHAVSYGAPSADISNEHSGQLRAFGSIQNPSDVRQDQEEGVINTDSSSLSCELRLRNSIKRPMMVGSANEWDPSGVHTSPERKSAPTKSTSHQESSPPDSESGPAGEQVQGGVNSAANSRSEQPPNAAFLDAEDEFCIPTTRSFIAQASGLFKQATVKKSSQQTRAASQTAPSAGGGAAVAEDNGMAGNIKDVASSAGLNGLKALTIAANGNEVAQGSGDDKDDAYLTPSARDMHALTNPVEEGLHDKEEEYHTPEAHKLGDNDLESPLKAHSTMEGSSLSLRPADGAIMSSYSFVPTDSELSHTHVNPADAASSMSFKRRGDSRHLFSSDLSAQLHRTRGLGASSQMNEISHCEGSQGLNVVGPNPEFWAPPVSGDVISPNLGNQAGEGQGSGETKDLDLIDIKRTMSEDKLMTRKLVGNGIESEEQSVSLGGEGKSIVASSTSRGARPVKADAHGTALAPETPSASSPDYQTRSPDGSLRNEMLPPQEQAENGEDETVSVRQQHGHSALAPKSKARSSLKPQKIPEHSAPLLSIGTAVHMATTAVRANLLRDKGFLCEQAYSGGTHTTYLSEKFTLKNFVAVLRVNIGPRKIHVEAKLRDSVSLARTPGRPVWDLDFAKGATPQYLWVPRVEDDGYKASSAASKAPAAASAPSGKGAAVAASGAASAAGRKDVKGSKDVSTDPHTTVSMPDGYFQGHMLDHKGAPPEIEFQVKRKNRSMLFRTLQLPGNWFDSKTPIRRVLTLQEKRLRQQLKTSVYENAGRIPPLFHTVGDSHMHVPALLYSPTLDKPAHEPAHASAPLTKTTATKSTPSRRAAPSAPLSTLHRTAPTAPPPTAPPAARSLHPTAAAAAAPTKPPRTTPLAESSAAAVAAASAAALAAESTANPAAASIEAASAPKATASTHTAPVVPPIHPSAPITQAVAPPSTPSATTPLDAPSATTSIPPSDRSVPPLYHSSVNVASQSTSAAPVASMATTTRSNDMRLNFNHLFTPSPRAAGVDASHRSRPPHRDISKQDAGANPAPDTFQEPLESAKSPTEASQPASKGPGSVHGAHAYRDLNSDIITPPVSHSQSLPLQGVRRQASGTAHEGTGILSENSGIFIDGTSKFLKAEGGAPLGGLASSRDHSDSTSRKLVKSLSRGLSRSAAAILGPKKTCLKADRKPSNSTQNPRFAPNPQEEVASSSESSNAVLPSDFSNAKAASQQMHNTSSMMSQNTDDNRSFIEQVTQPLPLPDPQVSSATMKSKDKSNTHEPVSAVSADGTGQGASGSIAAASGAQKSQNSAGVSARKDQAQALLWKSAEHDFSIGGTDAHTQPKAANPVKDVKEVKGSDAGDSHSKSFWDAMKSGASVSGVNNAVLSENKKVRGAKSWLRASESSDVRVEMTSAFETQTPPEGGSRPGLGDAAGTVDSHVKLSPVVPGAMCGDIQAVDVSCGDISELRTIVGAWENFSQVFPGEFLTAHDVAERVREERMHARAVARGAKPRAEMGPFGAETVAWIENHRSHVHALVFRNTYLKQVVVALQGSEGFSDWLRGFWPPSDPPSSKGKHVYPALIKHRKAPQNTFEQLERKKLLEGESKQPGKLHASWRHAWLSIESETFDLVDLVTGQNPEWTICTSGHSLGGALATVAAEAFATRADVSQKQRVECYSFGAPRVGNHAWAKHFDAVVDDSWRFTKLADVAPGYKFPFDVFHRHVKGGVALKSSSSAGSSNFASIGVYRNRNRLQLAWSKASSDQIDAIGSEELQENGWIEPVKEYSGVSGFAVARWRQVRNLLSRKKSSTGGANSMHEFGDSILDVSLQILRSRPDSASGPLRPSTNYRDANVPDQNLPDPSAVQRMEAAIMSVKALMHEVPRRSTSSRF